MAIVAPLSSYKKKNLLIIAAVLIGVALWFAYDGKYNQNFIDKHTTANGTPDPTLVFHHKAPPYMIGIGILFGIYFVIVRNKKVVADDSNIIAGKTTISYDSIEKINKTHFDKKGFFVITYSQDGQGKELKLSDRTYDNLPAVLDHIVSKIS